LSTSLGDAPYRYYMAKKRSKYSVHVKWQRGGGIWMRLYNFDVNSAFLQAEHRQWLNDVAVPFLEKEPQRSFLLVGFTSRSGTEAYNRVLSKRRADAVHEFFYSVSLGGRLDPRFGDGIFPNGEKQAASQGKPDGSEDDYDRACEVWLLPNLIETLTGESVFEPRREVVPQMPGLENFG
jgi:hypothetical protein